METVEIKTAQMLAASAPEGFVEGLDTEGTSGDKALAPVFDIWED